MRIALIARRFDPSGGGTERDLIVTAEYLRAAGHRIVIYAEEVRANQTSFEVRRVPVPRLGRALRVLRFAQTAPAIARRDADLVVSFARTIGADVLRSGGGAHISYVRAAARWRGRLGKLALRLSTYHRMQIAIERLGFTAAQLRCAIAVSNFVRDDLIEQFELTPEKALTLYNGIDLERFRPALDPQERAAIRSRIGVADGAPLVAFVGNGFARKGLEFLIRAWPAIGRGARLLVIGQDRGLPKFRRLTRRLGVERRIIFVGHRDDTADLLSAADCLALPALFEPFGNVVMEAMACGLPVLTSGYVGATELLPDAMRRFIVANPADPAEIAEKLSELIERLDEFGETVRAAAAKHTWDDHGRRLIALVESLSETGSSLSGDFRQHPI
ncbi:MAG: glycosyltransferase family 4 protein [Candidatus Binataceae bacterium]|nr:glycosyltransferase family 4 protein [Candidatus Binataceae bacterium]